MLFHGLELRKGLATTVPEDTQAKQQVGRNTPPASGPLRHGVGRQNRVHPQGNSPTTPPGDHMSAQAGLWVAVAVVSVCCVFLIVCGLGAQDCMYSCIHSYASSTHTVRVCECRCEDGARGFPNDCCVKIDKEFNFIAHIMRRYLCVPQA